MHQNLNEGVYCVLFGPKKWAGGPMRFPSKKRRHPLQKPRYKIGNFGAILGALPGAPGGPDPWEDPHFLIQCT